MSSPLVMLAIPDIQTLIASAGAIGMGIGVGVGAVYAAFRQKQAKADLDAYKLWDEARRESIAIVLGKTEHLIGRNQERLDEVASEVRALREEIHMLRSDFRTLTVSALRRLGMLDAVPPEE